MTMVEKVAIAIEEVFGRTPVHGQPLKASIIAARAAIAALREPTKEMCEAVAFGNYTTTSHGDEHTTFDYFSEENAADAFVAMIDAALNEKAPTPGHDAGA